MDRTYTTRFRNEMSDMAAALYDSTGRPLDMLLPGEEKVLETWNPATLYARWKEVVFRKDGGVELTENPDWPRPEGRWLIEALNLDGAGVERRIIGAREVVMPRNIPRLIGLDLSDRMAAYARLEIRRVTERVPSQLFPGYNEFQDVLNDVLTDRPEAELRELEEARKRAVEDV